MDLNHDLEGQSLCEIGCGAGHLLDHLNERGIQASYRGVDLSPAMIAAARERHPEGQTADLIRVSVFEAVIGYEPRALPYLGLPEDYHFGAHGIAVVGFDPDARTVLAAGPRGPAAEADRVEITPKD